MDARTVAWAAHRLAAAPDPARVPALVRALRSWSTRPGAEAAFVRLHLLDALVQTNARVAGADLLRHVDGITEVAAFLLLAGEPRANQRELLELFRRPLPEGDPRHDVTWDRAGTLLSEQRAPGFAAQVLRELALGQSVHVYDPGQRPGVGCGGAVLESFGDEPCERLAGFPPVPEYRFAPTGHIRVLRARVFTTGRARLDFDDRRRYGWLATMADFAWRNDEVVDLVYRGCEAVAADVEAQQRRFANGLRAAITALVAAGALTREEAEGLELTVTTTVWDGRHTKTGELPALPTTAHVVWRDGGVGDDGVDAATPRRAAAEPRPAALPR